MNIDEMQAGRELDALIAERVMGWHADTANPYYWFNSDGKYGAVRYLEDDTWEDVWSPSDDIAAAWQVVERMIELDTRNEYFSLEHFRYLEGKCYKAEFQNYAIADTAPLAICRAALKALPQKGEPCTSTAIANTN